jgi:hypothetical protein
VQLEEENVCALETREKKERDKISLLSAFNNIFMHARMLKNFSTSSPVRWNARKSCTFFLPWDKKWCSSDTPNAFHAAAATRVFFISRSA